MQRNAVIAALFLLLAAPGLISCDCADVEPPPNYRELAAVIKARVGACLSNQGFQPSWPTTAWAPEPGTYDYEHPEPVNNLSLVSDGTEYRLYFVNRAAVLYIVATAGLSRQRTSYGPLPLSIRCPPVRQAARHLLAAEA